MENKSKKPFRRCGIAVICSGLLPKPEMGMYFLTKGERTPGQEWPCLLKASAGLLEHRHGSCESMKRAMPRVKTIMMTGLPDADSIQNALRAGADGYLIKPVAPDQCLAALKFA